MASDDVTIVDFGAHLHTTAPDIPIFDYIEETAGAPIQEDPDAVADLYARAGIDAAVLSQPAYIGHDDATETATANDDYLELLDDYDQFYALAALPNRDTGEATAREFERCLEAGYNGAALEVGHGCPDLTDESMTPVLEVADDTGAPVLVHPKIMESVHPDVLDDRWALNAVFGREVVLAANLCQVIHGGILDRYPDLNLVFHHNGGNVASMLERVELQLDPARWTGLDELKPYDEFRHLLEDRVYIDTSGYGAGETAFATSLETVPASSVLFATDFPYETRTEAQFEAIVNTLRACTDGEDRRKVLGENALDLLVNT